MLAMMHSHLFSTSIQKPHQTVVDNPEWKMVPKNLHGKRFAILEEEKNIATCLTVTNKSIDFVWQK